MARQDLGEQDAEYIYPSPATPTWKTAMRTNAYAILASHVETPVANLMRSDSKEKIRIRYASDFGIVANQHAGPGVLLKLG